MATTKLLFLFSLAVSVSCGTVLQIEDDLVLPQSRVFAANLKTVKNYKSCGGQGKILNWQFATCKDSDMACEVPADGLLRKAQMDFIPSKDISAIGVLYKLTSTDGKIDKAYNLDVPILNHGVKKGQPYSITNVGGAGAELKGKFARFQYILYDKESNDVEICAEAMFQYV